MWLCAQRRLRSTWASTQSDRVFAVRSMGSLLWTQAFFMRTAKILIRLGGCPGWSESSPGAHAILLVLSALSVLILDTEYEKTLQKRCAPSDNSDQPAHPCSLIRLFAKCSMGIQGCISLGIHQLHGNAGWFSFMEFEAPEYSKTLETCTVSLICFTVHKIVLGR